MALPLLNHCLLPRTKGIEATIMETADLLDAVYDVTIAYDKAFTVRELLRGGVNTRAHLHIRRYPISAVPRSAGDIAEWLMKRWQEKDTLLEGFAKHRSFPPPPMTIPWRVAPHGVTWTHTWNCKWYYCKEQDRDKEKEH